MLAIVRRFFQIMAMFCLAILSVYAQERSSLDIQVPTLIINLSSVGADVFVRQAQLWFFLLAVAVFVCFVTVVLLGRPDKPEVKNRGDVLARQALYVWLVFVLLLIVGFSMPLLRIWIVLGG